MSCRHSPSRVSVGGYYTCLWCLERVRHPWHPVMTESSAVHKTGLSASSGQETGIERVEREQADWPARMGVDVKV
jgi:hypothetical protein